MWSTLLYRQRGNCANTVAKASMEFTHNANSQHNTNISNSSCSNPTRNANCSSYSNSNSSHTFHMGNSHNTNILTLCYRSASKHNVSNCNITNSFNNICATRIRTKPFCRTRQVFGDCTVFATFILVSVRRGIFEDGVTISKMSLGYCRAIDALRQRAVGITSNGLVAGTQHGGCESRC